VCLSMFFKEQIIFCFVCVCVSVFVCFCSLTKFQIFQEYAIVFECFLREKRTYFLFSVFLNSIFCSLTKFQIFHKIGECLFET
jgi:hypothetical protein